MDPEKLALFCICLSMWLHFGRHWVLLSCDIYSDHKAARLREHLDWTKPAAERPRRRPVIRGKTFNR